MDSKAEAAAAAAAIEEFTEEQAIVIDSKAIEDFVVEELKDGGSLCNEYEFNKLMEEMESTIRQLQESDFYCNMLQQFQNSPDFQTHIHRVLGNNDYEQQQRIQIVIYGLGSIQFRLRSQYQLAMAILLSRDMSHWIDQVISIFDPCFTPLDAKVVMGLGHRVENINEYFFRKVDKPTMFYLPCVDFPELGNLLEANWCPSRLNKIMLFTNVYPGWVALSSYAEKALEYAVKFDCHYNYKGPKLPCKTKWPFDETFFYFFNLLPETNMGIVRKRSKPNMFVVRRSRDVEDGDFQVLDETAFAKNCVRLVKSSIRITSPKLFEAYDDTPVNTREGWLNRMHRHRFPAWPGRIKWCPPYSGWIKLNFSAAYYNQSGSRRQVVGYGGLFHDENNECLHSFSGPLLEDLDEYAAFDGGVVDLDFANAVALRKGLKVFMELPSRPNVRKLIIEGDAVSILRWANCLMPPPKRLAEIFQEIFILLSRMEAAVLPIYKEANSMAIELAKERAIQEYAKQRSDFARSSSSSGDEVLITKADLEGYHSSSDDSRKQLRIAPHKKAATSRPMIAPFRFLESFCRFLCSF